MNQRLAFILSCTIFAAACGNSGETKTTDSSSAAKPSTSTPSTNAAGDKGLELIGASDCTTCHRLDKAASGASIGPAYDEVAAKYAPAADTTIDRLAGKIISGGQGVWGTVPMTPHAALSKDDAITIVKYIMTLKK